MGKVPSLVISASILGIFQAVILLVSSVIIIFLHYDVIKITRTSLVQELIYGIFIKEKEFATPKLIITPEHFCYFMFCYVIVSSSWLILSSALPFVEKPRDAKILYKSWSLNVFLVSILDLILAIQLGIDLSTWIDEENGNTSYEVKEAYGIAIAAAAKLGFLWICNCIMAIFLALFYPRRWRNTNGIQDVPTGNEFIHAFTADIRSNEPPMRTTPLSSFHNPSYEGDSLSVNSSLFDNQPRTANINRPGKRSPIQTPAPVSVPPAVAPKPYNKPMLEPHDRRGQYNHPQNGVSRSSRNVPLPDVQKTSHNGRSQNHNSHQLAPVKPNGREQYNNARRHSPKVEPYENFVTPYIPPADYTPPSSPKPRKSVLKQNPRY